MTQLHLRELKPEFGTEVNGLDVGAAVHDRELRRELQALFDSRGVLVLRDLEIDQLQQTNLSRMLIRLDPIDVLPPGRAQADPMYVSNKEDRGAAPYGRLLFHSDMMSTDEPCQLLSLYGVHLEPPVAPTIFASTVYAWETLPDDLRARVESRSAVHGHEEGYPTRAADDPDVLRPAFSEAQTATMPIALRNPRTGGTLLYVAQQGTCEINGLAADESEELLEQLFAHLYRSEHLYEHDWREHDLVAWDNLSVQHARPNVALDGPVRTLRKVFAPAPTAAKKVAAPRFDKVS
jgi:taurine dioxygenase